MIDMTIAILGVFAALALVALLAAKAAQVNRREQTAEDALKGERPDD